MNKKFFIFILLLIVVFEYNRLVFASQDTLSQSNPCDSLFTSQRNLIGNIVIDDFTKDIAKYKNYEEYQAHRVIDRMLKDLISAYQQKILEKISSNPDVKNLRYTTNNNPIIVSSYIDTFMERLERIFQENISYHLFRIRYTPEKQLNWDEEMFLLRYLELYFNKQFGENEIKGYISRSILDFIEDDLSALDSEEEAELKHKFKYTRKEKMLMRLRPELTTTIDSIFNVNNKYVEILLQHILTYYILNDENYNLDPTLKEKMLNQILYININNEPVLIKDFFPDVIDNVTFLNTHRSYYLDLITDPSVVDKKEFLNNLYPNIFVTKKPKTSRTIDQHILEQDMMFVVNYMKYSLHPIILEKEVLDAFQPYLNISDNDILNPKQVFYVGNYPLSLEKLIKALFNTPYIKFSNRDIIDLILGLYHTNIEAINLDYDTAAKKLKLKDIEGIDNNTSLYFAYAKDINIDYVYDFYQILYYLLKNDPEFSKKLGLKNSNMVNSFKETLLEKLVL